MTDKKPALGTAQPLPPSGAQPLRVQFVCGRYVPGLRVRIVNPKAVRYATYREAEKTARHNHARGGPADIFAVAAVSDCTETYALLGSVTRDSAGVYVALTWEGCKYA
jgi:hypothetical protein